MRKFAGNGMVRLWIFAGLILPGLLAGLACPSTPPAPSNTPVFGYEVLHTYPHDRTAFTQGLVFEGGALYEGTGLYGQSSLRMVDLSTGEVLQRADLSRQFFGEGIVLHDDRIAQLTWKANKAFVYNQASFEATGEFSYPTEGWGITHDGTHFIMSDGTSFLYFRDSDTFELVRRVRVHDDTGAVDDLNELEYIHGEVFANIWRTDRIARIAPETGKVNSYIDLSGILPAEDRDQTTDVLNGIAFDKAGDRLFVTGKRWPRLFEIKLVPPPDPEAVAQGR